MLEQEVKALDTLVKLARSSDADIRRNVAGAMYRLAMHKSIKRHFVAKVTSPCMLLRDAVFCSYCSCCCIADQHVCCRPECSSPY